MNFPININFCHSCLQKNIKQSNFAHDTDFIHSISKLFQFCMLSIDVWNTCFKQFFSFWYADSTKNKGHITNFLDVLYCLKIPYIHSNQIWFWYTDASNKFRSQKSWVMLQIALKQAENILTFWLTDLNFQNRLSFSPETADLKLSQSKLFLVDFLCQIIHHPWMKISSWKQRYFFQYIYMLNFKAEWLVSLLNTYYQSINMTLELVVRLGISGQILPTHLRGLF